MNAFMHALACNRIMRILSVKDNKLTAQGLMYVLNGMLRRLDSSNTIDVLQEASALKNEKVSPRYWFKKSSSFSCTINAFASSKRRP
jgi:hypothetical protein